MNNKVREIRLYFFGNELQKKEVYLSFVIKELPFFLEDYYVERDWLGGPNYRVITSDNDININFLEKQFQQFCLEKYGYIEKSTILENIEKYKNQSHNLAVIERRTKTDINIQNHLELKLQNVDEYYIKQRFNSLEHFNIHTQSLMKLQPFINKYITYFTNLERLEKIKFTNELLYSSLVILKIPNKFSILTYVSHIEGMMAIAKQYGYYDQYIKIFEKFNDIIKNEDFSRLNMSFLRCWEETLTEVLSDINMKIGMLKKDEKGYFTKEKQSILLKQNINEIESEFHNLLINNNFEELSKQEEHIKIRILTNIIYKCMHMLGVTFNEKNISIYILVESILDKYNTNWKDIVIERGE